MTTIKQLEKQSKANLKAYKLLVDTLSTKQIRLLRTYEKTEEKRLSLLKNLILKRCKGVKN